MAKYDCLIVDDEETLSKNTLEYFNMFDVSTYWVSDASSCFKFLEGNIVDIILLDINLGDSSGYEICKKLRVNYDIPIIFISARTSDDDIILALNIGGDDYIQKPYSLSVLLAKVKLALKKYKGNVSNQIIFDDFIIDLHLKKLFHNDQEVVLKAMEYKLLVYLAENKNKIISKGEIFRNVWNDVITSDGTLNVHIRRLREKIEKNPNNPEYIKTVWGTGYTFVG
ncbi:MAG: response regulator transcription factor [Bacilli bacterium]|nr:response regulator transcription factor [Bacilli bacterium]